MNDIIKGYTGEFTKKHRKRRKYISIFMALAFLVAFSVIWQMKLTGISMNADAMCGKEEHQHDETCYEKVLICGYPDSGQSGNVSAEGHKHTDACYETRRNCVCGQPEHQHNEACYDENGQLICEVEEHQHGEACYVTESVQICGQEEAADSDAASTHVHTDACYEKRLVCEKEEHTHTIACMSDKNADLESEADWMTTLPSELKHKWAEDLLAVADSQLGYQESTRNFVLDEDGERTRGYTRYGQWYGSPYGDWCAMFVSWCLHYAEIPEEAVPYAAGCYAWTVELDEMDLYHTPDTYSPEAGDIIFFYSGDGINHVGIVESVDEEKETVHTIEGNAGDVVCKNEYELADKSIAGYGSLQEAEKLYEIKYRGELPEQTVVAELYTDESFSERIEEEVITVSGKIPNGAKIKAYPVSTEIEGKQILAAYDITIFLEDGTIYEPETPLKVVLKLPKMEKTVETRRISVYYVPDEPEEKAERISSDIHDLDVEFQANHFSVYALAFAENEIEIGSEAELTSKLKTGGDFILTNDITLTGAFTTITLGNEWTGTLDLNGHTITCVNGKSLFNVGNGASLTIKDSEKKDEQTVSPSPDGANYGNVATHDSNTLTYYVTESVVTQPAVGATAETLVKHTVPIAGGIKGSNEPIIKMTGGSFTLESGMLYDGTNRAFEVSGGTLNLQGGYVFGFKKEDNGGAALVSGSTIVNLSGSVLTGNASTGKSTGKGCGGAIEAISNAVVNITGGVISGNRADGIGNWDGNGFCGGGGIHCNDNVIVNMSGGYLTNNRADSDGEGKHYFDGGGGIFLTGRSKFNLSGGYITGNISFGGSGVRTDWQKSTRFTMDGGFVSGNYATSTEGGGIAITSGGVGYINGGYITNNITNTQVHWGGGGLFCSDGAYLYVRNVIVTDNQAGGFGGGVAGCSTGRVYVCVKDGGAIFENSAAGENMSGDSSEKREDIEYGKNSPVFMANGFADYFCALNSLVEGSMLGGASANWSGSCDGSVVSNLPGDMSLEAAYVMGLTAHPTQEGINAALAPGLAGVYVNGNSSHTHGGGILCNGYLLIGDKNPIAVGSRFKLNGTKRLQNNGTNMSLEGYEFKFSVKDENGNVVSVGTSDKDGNINFDRLISFSEELCKTKIQENGQSATFVYYLTEDEKQENLDVAIDPAQYKISVTIKREDSTIPMVDAQGNPITKTYYKITGVKVQKSTDAGKTWGDVAYTWSPSKDEQHAGNLTITNGTTFTNQKKKAVSLNVVKKWPAGDNPPEFIKVDLKRNGVVVDTVELNKENGWSYTWSNLAEGPEYTVYEHLVPGYEAAYTTAGNSESTITITNKKVSKLYDLEITKVSDADHNVTLAGAEFELSKDGETLTFTKGKNGVYSYDENGTAVLVTDDNGKIMIDKLPEGEYILKETKAPAGYEVAEEKVITLGGEEKTTVEITVEDKKIEYILPESGGRGTFGYLLVGFLLMSVSIIGVIKRKKV